MAIDTPGFVIRITFLDFGKAYDVIDKKLCWIIFVKLAFVLSDRIQVTKFGSELSDKFAVNGGIPQG
jgi:hypothetical protein